MKHRALAACLAVMAAAALPAPPAVAQATGGWHATTAKELGARCHSTDAAKHAACVGYVTGVYDLQFAQTPVRGVCPPANLDPDNLTAVVLAYIDTHDDGPAPTAIAQSVVRFFPCTGAETPQKPGEKPAEKPERRR